MKLLIRAPFLKEDIKKLKIYFDEIIYDPWTKTGERYYEQEMAEVLCKEKPDALITELDKITTYVLSKYDKLKFIGDCRANPANIDVNACTEHNIPIMCTPGRNAQAVAEMVVGLLLTYMRKIIPAREWLNENKWVVGTTPYFLWMGDELCGKKVGFVGFGAVGQSVAEILEGFGCDIDYCDPYVNINKYHKSSLEDIFKECDIVSIHLPVLNETRGMIDKKLFGLMKKDAIFVNTARSAVVNEKDLLEALNHINGAIIDVFDEEPPSKELIGKYSKDNVLLTPHICGATYEVADHQSKIMTKNIEKFFADIDLDKIVYNKEVVTL